MVFSGKNKPNPNLAIGIDGESVNEVEKTKFLGVIIGKTTYLTYQEKSLKAFV